MNPEDDFKKALAVENVPTPSLFGYVGKSLTDIKGLISGVVTDQQPTTNNQQQEKIEVESGGVYTLPLSEPQKHRIKTESSE